MCVLPLSRPALPARYSQLACEAGIVIKFSISKSIRAATCGWVIIVEFSETAVHYKSNAVDGD